MIRDAFGLQVSANEKAARAFDGAAELLRLYRGDPIAALDGALEHDPDFALAWTVRGAVLAQQTDKSYFPEAQRSLQAAAAAADKASQRERDHIAAAQAWLDERFVEAVARWGRIAQEHPRDILALQFAHLGDFFLGQQAELRDRPLQALRAWSSGDHARHAILGMAAFGLEECGDYARAEALGREAASIESRDGWAVHAVAHVCEMQGRAKDGVQWLVSGANDWAPESGFAYHNWWHLALFHLDSEDLHGALALYDEKVRPQSSQILLEMIDASALLWRLHLLNADVGDRFDDLANAWERTIDDQHYSFNDLHAVMAMLGAGRNADAHRILASLRKIADGNSDNAAMARDVGLPAAQAFVDFEEGRYGDAADALLRIRGRSQRFGGSHAQRDVLTLTAFEAALKAGRKEQAQAIAAERTTHKPHSLWARGLAKRAAA